MEAGSASGAANFAGAPVEQRDCEDVQGTTITTDSEIEAAQFTVAQQQHADVEFGRVKIIPGEEVFREVSAALAAKRGKGSLAIKRIPSLKAFELPLAPKHPLTPMDKETLCSIVDFVTRSFRDVADRDYICARACHRLGLEQQFLWASLQAVEKYLKGILLFNLKSTKGYGHNVKQAYDALSSVSDIPFQIPKDVVDFITYLDDQGANRYFTFPYYTVGRELFHLDRSVWHLRRYCQRLHWEPVMPDGTKKQLLPIVLNTIHDPCFDKAPNKFRILGGSLEKILEGKPTLVRRELVWKNFYYGKQTKGFVKNVVLRSSSGNPTHFLHPNAYTELAKLVTFEQPIRDHFAKLTASSSSTPVPAESQKSPA